MIKSLFKKKKAYPLHSLDLHSHLIPGIDDGVSTIDETIAILREFESWGMKKVITTPHIFSEVYPNKESNILARHKKVVEQLNANGVGVELEVAAEYYVDEELLTKLNNNHPLLTFGEKYLLFETPFLLEPKILTECIFMLITKGYVPVMAHPERYIYLQEDNKRMGELRERGVLFQVNLGSLVGYYSENAKNVVKILLKKSWIDFIGSDCHNQKHQHVLSKVWGDKLYKKIIESGIRNDELI